ncbi:MAG: MSHA biogenesis protein MshO [Alphaproteobacteria bacterium]|jgi:MSHA biogenesis protein MshO
MAKFPTLETKRTSKSKANQAGFTLIELVVVIVILGIVSISMTGIGRNAMDTVITVSERENLVREGSFLVERFNRELKGSVPNSVRIRGNALVHCVEFVPMQWNGIYLTLPLEGQPSDIADLMELSNIQGQSFAPSISDFAIVYPTRASQVYDASLGHRRSVESCSDDGDGDCSTLDDTDKVIQLEVSDGFAQTSPSRRIYFAQEAISYCMRENQVYRHVNSINESQTLYTTGGSLMAQNLVNQLAISELVGEQNPFKSLGPSFTRNAATQALFIFGREEERVTFMQEVQIPNVP